MLFNKESLRKFGEELLRAREYKKISLEQISDITKISERFLGALEEGQWDLLPQPYTKAFLKAYAEAVGMNVAKVMQKYEEIISYEILSEGESAPAPEASVEDKRSEVQLTEDMSVSRTKISKFVISFVAVLLLIFVITLIIITNKEQADTPTAVTAFGESKVEIEEEIPSEVSMPSSQVPADRAEGRENLTEERGIPIEEFVVTARALERCWLYAVIDGSEIRDVYLYPNDGINLKANREVYMVVGNAGGLELRLGQDIFGALGPKGKPVTLLVNSEGIKSQRLGAWQPNLSDELSASKVDTLLKNRSVEEP